MKILSGIFTTFLLTNTAFAHDVSHRVDSHAPIGVMGDHTHKTGEWMLSYRYMNMLMKGNKEGSDNLTPAEVRAKGYMMAPLDMTMDMHIFGGMYGVNDQLTIMGMLPYIEKDMTMLGMGGAISSMESDGFGDAKFTAMYKAREWDHSRQTIQLNAGISLPTGSTDEEGTNGLKLPYPMQLGSGTYDLLPALVYKGYNENWSWGSKASAVLRIGENSDNYSLGNEYGLTVWGARKLNDSFSLSARLDGKDWGDIDGEDPELAARATSNMSPVFKTSLRGGTRVDAFLGVNYQVTSGALKGHRLALEVGAPIYEYLDGPQLSTQSSLMLSWQKSF